ncbi:hypothetical protein OSTOST_15219, partial [Ostertagia ostertagi]
MKTIVDYLLEAKEKLDSLASENKELFEQVDKLCLASLNLKVVLPTARFKEEALRRAPKLRVSQFRGIYIRPSLSKAERDKLRSSRLASRGKPENNSKVHSINLPSSPMPGSDISNKSMDIMSPVVPLNTQSLPKNADSLIFHLTESCFDIVALTETWLKSALENSTLLGILGHEYSLIRCDRIRKPGGGVAILVRRKFSYQVIFKESISDSYELLCCDISSRCELCRIAVIYRTPGCSHKFTLQLFKALTDLSTCQYPFLAMGDFNMPDVDWTGNDK